MGVTARWWQANDEVHAVEDQSHRWTGDVGELLMRPKDWTMSAADKGQQQEPWCADKWPLRDYDRIHIVDEGRS